MFAIIDIETTGGYGCGNRITEIAILIHDGKKVVKTFQTLINPEVAIPPNITRLTGISNEMVKNAPKFYEVAKEIYFLTQDKIFVAHNVNFDYSFIREEFKMLGSDFNRKKLCTVSLARKIFPGYKSYSLGNICSSLGIVIKNRHRAMGDAKATAILFSQMVANDNEKFILKSANAIDVEGNIPANVAVEAYRKLPQETGLYYFHDAHEKIIYIGKAVNIKKRIQSHFNGQQGSKLNFLDKIYNITFSLTGTELIALLFESHEIKKWYPPFNKAQKNSKERYILLEYLDGKGIQRLDIVRYNKKFQSTRAFNNFLEGRTWLSNMCDKFFLCPKCCGLQVVSNECLDTKIEKCKGVCCGKESVEEYNFRLKNALEFSLGKLETHIIIGKGRNEDEKSIVLVEQGEYKGFGYTTKEASVETIEEVSIIISPFAHNSSTRKILNEYFNSNKVKV